ncbi:hypothetical protein AGMMS49525_06880 [Bacteroidia bacterium]|nr:hypothetical protein AGMMS49525_06880 [Bacteroidia bacterium]
MKKTIVLTIASLLLTVSSVAATSSWTSGSTTVVLTADSTLTISGTGAMDNYTDVIAPWVVSHRHSIKTVVINNGVTSIGKGAFSYCSSLTSVTCLATTPPTLSNVNFTSVSTDTLYVPATSLDAKIDSIIHEILKSNNVKEPPLFQCDKTD